MDAIRKEPLSRRIIRSLGMFGGVQGVMILFSVVRTKLVALWLGSEGVGMFSIFNSALDMVSGATQLSLRQSSVRDISMATGEERVRFMVSVVMRWAWTLGIAGAFVMMIFAPLLAEWTLGSEFTWSFRLLSVAVFILSLQNGWQAVMQGTEHLARLAKAQLYGAIAGFVVSVPLYYFFGLASIVPSILIYTASGVTATFLFRAPIEKPAVMPTLTDTAREGRRFIKLGFFMTVSSFVSLAAGYVFFAWLNRNSSTETVGYFSAGYTVVNRYVGIVMTSLAAEYYPRLSRIIDDRQSVIEHVSGETAVMLKVLMQLSVFFIAFSSQIIAILYTSDFEVIVEFISLAMAGTVFRAVSWCMAFVIVAKGNGKVYVFTEVLSSVVYLAVNVTSYTLYGLTGLGYAYCIWWICYTLSTGFIYFRFYGYRLSAVSLKIICAAVIVAVAAFAIRFTAGWAGAALFGAVVSVPCLLSLRKDYGSGVER